MFDYAHKQLDGYRSYENAQDISAWIDNYIGNTGNLMFMNAARFIAGLPGNSYEFYDWYKMNGDADAYKKR